jgi:hypothetical protein
MHRARILPLIALVGIAHGLAGCASLFTLPNFPAAPDELKAASDAKGANNLERVHDLVQDSQAKCNAFVIKIFRTTANTNTQLDITSTVLAAVGTVVKPLTTVHALAAGNTIASGAKTSISTEYLNGLTTNHLVQAIQSTYTTDIAKYVAYLNTLTDATSVSIVAERTKVLSYHNECTLPAANASISSALQPAAPPAGKSSQVSITYTVGQKDDIAAIASGIASLLNSDANYKAAGVTALSAADTVTIAVPRAITVSWKTPIDFVAGAGVSTLTETAAFQLGPPAILKVSGTPHPGDAITLAALVEPAATATQALVSPQKAILGASYTVKAGETPTTIAANLADAINKDPNFKKAPGTASLSGPTITITVPNSALTWGAPFAFDAVVGQKTATETVDFHPGPPATITIGGKAQKGDSITISATQPTDTPVVPGRITLPVAPPTAILGTAPAMH